MATTATRESIEYLKCVADPAYFVDTYCQIDEPQGAELSVIPFRLWGEQVRFLWTLLTEKRVIVLKARQLGITWLNCAYALWKCLFEKGRVVLAFSRGQSEADEIVRRVKAMYDRLPKWMLKMCPGMTKRATSELGWANESRIESFPATEGAGRSQTASLVLMDETAWMKWGEAVYTAAKPTVDNGGQLIVFSTANGEDNIFYTLWDGAKRGINGFKAIFLAWWVHPKRTAEWYARTERESVSSAVMRQEYPATPEEAFTNTGAERFLPSMLWWDNCKEVLPPLTMNEPMVLGCDAGVSSDNFALVGVTRHPDPAKWEKHVAVRFVQKWVPPRDGAIDFAEPEKEVKRLCEQFNVVALAYDPHQLHKFATDLQKEGVVWTIPFNQGADRLEADKQLLDLITNREISHNGDETLREHIDNADKQIDGQERKVRIVKRTASKKIDAAVALSMAAYKCLELNL